ncbi:MAG TPA: helix-turn-helix domain-containing protein [Gemmatimonadaceae bacterium]|jgi:DNA-binding HxlR family transcriptional regulator|nr:helix-turn-helix domain-containing protein [Gemmatimonadaceae bacterium]
MAEHQGAVCAKFHRAIELIGRRWTGAIIQFLLAGRARYHEIRVAIPEVSDRMLSERLKELETEGIVVRHVVPDAPVRVEYELTTKGRELDTVMSAIGVWAEKWATATPEPATSAQATAGAHAGSAKAAAGG